MARFQVEDEFERELASMARQPRPDLVRTWIQLLGAPPSKGMSAALLRQAVAYELQVRRWGGLSSGVTRLLCKAVHDQHPSIVQRPPELQPGFRLLREWNGREHVVDVTEAGFEWGGAPVSIPFCCGPRDHGCPMVRAPFLRTERRVTSQKQLRCAIYTRKSTSEGLDQEFNSLDAQREACTAYIKSQRHEGWKLVPTRYDDGGLSGATMERPALARLLDEIRARRVDVVVVYKVDRLTRSLSDFAKMVEVFDANEASFVSVTQQFNTTNSMGRLTLNVLLSFAQFEREVTAERIRDKIAASKRKGMWMGGGVSLGYDSVEKRLVVNEEEAAVVRRVFELYDQLGTVQAVKAEADRIGLRSKCRGSAPRRSFTRGHLYKLLGNPLYVGDVRHGDATCKGEHDRIIDRDLWDRVQQRLKANAVNRTPGRRPSRTLLVGLIFAGADQRLVATHSNRRGRRYRYYSTRATDHPSADGSSRALRFPASELDAIVCDALSRVLKDGSTLSEAIVHLQQQPCASLRALLECAEDFAQQLSTAEADARRELLRQLVQRIDIGPDCLRFTIRPRVLNDFRRSMMEERSSELDPGADEFLILNVPAQLPARQHGSSTALFSGVRSRPRFDLKLIRAVAEGKAWYERIKSGEFPTLRALAKAVGRDRPDVGRRIRLAFLAPDIVTAIVAGEQPNTLTIGALLRAQDIPLSWAEQRRLFGFHDPGDASR